MHTDRMTPTEELLDRAIYRTPGERYFLVPHHYPPHARDTVLAWFGYYEGLPHLKLLTTDRDIPSGIELRLYPSVVGDSINIGFTTLDGTRVEITVESRTDERTTITFEFDLPSEVS